MSGLGVPYAREPLANSLGGAPHTLMQENHEADQELLVLLLFPPLLAFEERAVRGARQENLPLLPPGVWWSRPALRQRLRARWHRGLGWEVLPVQGRGPLTRRNPPALGQEGGGPQAPFGGGAATPLVSLPRRRRGSCQECGSKSSSSLTKVLFLTKPEEAKFQAESRLLPFQGPGNCRLSPVQGRLPPVGL